MMLLTPRTRWSCFPATTRYESPGGGTETSTERRIIFSPEVPGRRIGSAKPEWEVFGEVAARVRPDRADSGPLRVRRSRSATRSRARCRSTRASSGSARQGDQFQWGGPRLFADGVFTHPRRQGALHRRHPAAAPAAGRRVPRVHPARQAVQLHGPARGRSPHRRAAGRRPDVARRRRAPRPARRRPGAAGLALRQLHRARADRPHEAAATSRSTGRRATCCSPARRSTPPRASPTTTRSSGWRRFRAPPRASQRSSV